MTAPCKHLDHSEAYAGSCILRTLNGFSCEVKYWERQSVPYPDAPRRVQFCGQGRGRINGIFQCYNPGELSCYESDVPSPCPPANPEPAGGTFSTEGE